MKALKIFEPAKSSAREIGMKKLKKLVRNPNQFFFDYFAKKVGIREPDPVKPSRPSENYIIPPGFSFDENVHPYVQVAKKFRLKTGARTGHPDQSMLVRADILSEVLAYLFYVAYGFGASIRIYTLGGAVNLDVPRKELLRVRKIDSVFKKLSAKPDFVVEILGEFDNNFAAHFFVYDVEVDGGIKVRSQDAFVRRLSPSVFEEVYPDVIDEFGDWSFGTPWPVDIVFTWVNRDDPSWQEMWQETFPNEEASSDRYASKDELKYSLRAICKYLPWFHRIHIVSNCSRPNWLMNHPRICWVAHDEIFPDKSHLPSFNSHAIEACLHNIPGLSERYLYFNDDMFVTSPCYYSDFFDENDRTVAYLERYGMIWPDNVFDPSKEFLSPAIKSHQILRRMHPNYFAARLHKHSPYAMRKSVVQKIEELIPDELTATRASRRRHPEDINLPSFFYHHYALATGSAVHGDAGYLIVRPRNIKKLDKIGGLRGYKFLCFNDGDGSADNDAFLRRFKSIMNREFAGRSSFEIQYRPWARIRMSKTVMAYKTRVHRIPYLRRMLGDVAISLDDGRYGLWENAKRSWLSCDEGATYHMVVQDDAVIAARFFERLEVYLRQGRDVYCLFYRFKSRRTHNELNKAGLNSWRDGGFSFPRLQWANCLVVRTDLVPEMIEFSDRLDPVKYHNIDDMRFSQFFSQRGTDTYIVLPSLVDHLSEVDSTIRDNIPNSERMATWFADGVNGFLIEEQARKSTTASDPQQVDG